MNRHRDAKPEDRCELLTPISLLSPAVLRVSIAREGERSPEYTRRFRCKRLRHFDGHVFRRTVAPAAWMLSSE
jgi:hypothetical protein